MENEVRGDPTARIQEVRDAQVAVEGYAPGQAAVQPAILSFWRGRERISKVPAYARAPQLLRIAPRPSTPTSIYTPTSILYF